MLENDIINATIGMLSRQSGKTMLPNLLSPIITYSETESVLSEHSNTFEEASTAHERPQETLTKDEFMELLNDIQPNGLICAVLYDDAPEEIIFTVEIKNDWEPRVVFPQYVSHVVERIDALGKEYLVTGYRLVRIYIRLDCAYEVTESHK